MKSELRIGKHSALFDVLELLPRTQGMCVLFGSNPTCWSTLMFHELKSSCLLIFPASTCADTSQNSLQTADGSNKKRPEMNWAPRFSHTSLTSGQSLKVPLLSLMVSPWFCHPMLAAGAQLGVTSETVQGPWFIWVWLRSKMLSGKLR